MKHKHFSHFRIFLSGFSPNQAMCVCVYVYMYVNRCMCIIGHIYTYHKIYTQICIVLPLLKYNLPALKFTHFRCVGQ